jgi:hypothetical protein
MIKKGDEIIAAIIGGSRCGKTTLAIALSAMHNRLHRMRSIVFDPFYFEHNWGPHAWVTSDMEKFKRAVAGVKGCAVFWDESTTTMRNRSFEDVGFFSNIRHNHPAFYSIGHDPTVLSPTMRGNLSEAYIFRQSETRAAIWVELFTDTDMRQTTTLERREFIYKRAFEKIERRLPTLQELQTMKRP